jgi:hypothetical protein
MHNRLSAIVNDTDKKKKEKKPGAKPGAKKVLPPPPPLSLRWSVGKAQWPARKCGEEKIGGAEVVLIVRT